MGRFAHHIPEAIGSIVQARARIIEKACCLSADETLFKPDPSVWCVSEILEHVYLCEMWVLADIWSRAEADSVRSEPEIESADQGDTFEAIIRPFDAQKIKAPEPLIPSGTGNARFWVEALRANQEIVDALPQLFSETDPRKIVFPHFIVGPLNVIQWLEFLPYHLDRHRVQIEGLMC